MAKELELAIERALSLPETEQALLGRELLARIDALERVRDEIEVDLEGAPAQGREPLDIDGLVEQTSDVQASDRPRDDDWTAIQAALDQARHAGRDSGESTVKPGS
jgi:hypothetical protein